MLRFRKIFHVKCFFGRWAIFYFSKSKELPNTRSCIFSGVVVKCVHRIVCIECLRKRRDSQPRESVRGHHRMSGKPLYDVVSWACAVDCLYTFPVRVRKLLTNRRVFYFVFSCLFVCFDISDNRLFDFIIDYRIWEYNRSIFDYNRSSGHH